MGPRAEVALPAPRASLFAWVVDFVAVPVFYAPIMVCFLMSGAAIFAHLGLSMHIDWSQPHPIPVALVSIGGMAAFAQLAWIMRVFLAAFTATSARRTPMTFGEAFAGLRRLARYYHAELGVLWRLVFTQSAPDRLSATARWGATARVRWFVGAILMLPLQPRDSASQPVPVFSQRAWRRLILMVLGSTLMPPLAAAISPVLLPGSLVLEMGAACLIVLPAVLLFHADTLATTEACWRPFRKQPVKLSFELWPEQAPR